MYTKTLAVVMILSASGIVQGQIQLNEIMSANTTIIADEDGDYSDWIELYNLSDQPINITGYGLSDDYDTPFRWVFPDTTVPPCSFLFVWASGKDRAFSEESLHTNFSIKKDGEEILLTNSDGTRIDEIAPVIIQQDISWGRQNETEEMVYFNIPTPNNSNSTQGFSELLEAPAFSLSGGLYSEQIDLTITVSPGTTILYTLDGSEPRLENVGGTHYDYKMVYPWFIGEANPQIGPLLQESYESFHYNSPISIYNISQAPNTLSQNPSSICQPSWYIPLDPIFKGTVVRACAVKEGALTSPTTTKTYFVTNEENIPRYNLPVLALTIQENKLFGYQNGIYTPGIDYETFRDQYPEELPIDEGAGNYFRRGEENEQSGNLEIYNGTNELIFEDEVEVRIHGGITRMFPQKSLRIYAGTGDGFDGSLFFPFFRDLNDRVEGNKIDLFRRIILRTPQSAGYFNDPVPYFRDDVVQMILIPTGLDYQASHPVINFINGEYWGLSSIRERTDEYYFASHYLVNTDNVVSIKDWEVHVGEDTDLQEFLNMWNYVCENDMSNINNYNYIDGLMDIENYLIYLASEIYVNNIDWPQNNIQLWKIIGENVAASPYYDGRWRWLLFDLDESFIYSSDLGEASSVSHDTLSRITQGVYLPDQVKCFHSNMLSNDFVAKKFINIMADQINTIFKFSNVQKIINEYYAIISEYSQEHMQRWGIEDDIWEDAALMISFAEERPGWVREHIKNFFGLPGCSELSVSVSNTSHGSIRVNSILINGNTLGIGDISQPYPWHGVYFQGVPIQIEAVPLPGYAFAGWDGLPTGTAAFVEIELTDDLNLTANFERSDEPALLHYWSFNELSETPTYTVGSADMDIALAPTAELEYDTGKGFVGINARLEENAGCHLRVNNPLGSALVFHIPTIGFEDIIVKYEMRRSGQGAGIQTVSYTLDGESYEQFSTFEIYDDDPIIYELDFRGITGVADNSDFAVCINFAQGSGGTEGNNRIDNVTVESVPTGGNLPPVAVGSIGLSQGVEQGAPVLISLESLFTDPDNDPLTYEVNLDKPGIASYTVNAEVISLQPQLRGDVNVTVYADDGHNAPVPLSFRFLVYPHAYPIVEEGAYTFDFWSADEPDGAFPEHMLFMQTDVTDPGLSIPLEYAYHIPHDDYNEDDYDTIGFPYNNTRRTRINGLGEDGILFINTGRDRDLGGAILALDTTGCSGNLYASWLNSTIIQNERIYAIRIQYRIGYSGSFLDVTDEYGNIVEYYVHNTGHTQAFESIVLPEEILNKSYVQILWRYYYISGDSGPRASIGLDDIYVNQSFEGEGEALGEGEANEGELPIEGEEECIDNPEGCTTPLGGVYEIGNDLCLCVPCPVSNSSTYAWTKDGSPLADDGRVFGTTARTLQILVIECGDSGLYACTYDDGSKAVQVFEAQVTVVEQIPAMGTLGLLVLAAVFGALGLLARKKQSL